MEYRNLGKSGLKVSAVGLGTNQFGGKVTGPEVKNIVSAAIEAGVNFIDTADIYQQGRSEETIGEAIKGRRQKVVVASKVRGSTGDGPNDQGNSRHHICAGIENSLRRLQTDYIDLYQIHWWDENTPIEETMRALEDLVTAGKVRYIGCSSFMSWQMTYANELAEKHGWNPFITNQVHYHLLEKKIEDELMPACRYFGIGILPFFPLAGGFLTGKYEEGKKAPKGSRGESNEYVQKYMTPENYGILGKLTTFAEGFGKSLGDLAHAWLLAHPEVSSVISGVTSATQMLTNARSADWSLNQEEMEEINGIL